MSLWMGLIPAYLDGERPKSMSYRAILITLCLIGTAAFCQEGSPNHSGEVYALASGATSGFETPNSSVGFQVGGAWHPSPKISLIVDASRHFSVPPHFPPGALVTPTPNGSFTSFMAGPRIHGADHDGLSGFYQFFAGAEHMSIVGQKPSWNLMCGAGVGVDIRLAGPIVWRAIELDALLTDKTGPGIPGIRYSSGFVIRLGH